MVAMMNEVDKSPLVLGARHAEVVQSAIQHWLESNTISQNQATLLAETIVVQGFDWERLAKYSLRLAVLCLMVSITSIVLGETFKRIFKRLFELPAWLRSIATGAVALSVHVFAHLRSQRLPGQRYRNEAIHGVSALLFAVAATQLLDQLHESFQRATKDNKGEAASYSDEEDTVKAHKKKKREIKELQQRLKYYARQCVALGLGTIYGAIGILSKSNFIWSCSMIVLGYCCEEAAANASSKYAIWMESPLLLIGFGSSLIGAAQLMRSHPITAPLWSTTRIWGLLYLFVSLWLFSIHWYNSHSERPNKKRTVSWRFRGFASFFVFFVATVASIWHGLRFDDSTTKGFGLTFLGINLFTRFFDCFWEWSKPLFFAVLAATFAIIGRYAEDIWNMRMITVS